jgi:DNA-directed RNA polymerase specialized sigma24 family protein
MTPVGGAIRAPRLDEIPTHWDLLERARCESPSTASAARNALALQYAGGVRSYVRALVRDRQEADELSQEILLRLMRGNFARANPDEGRFRDLLKVTIRNMVRTRWTYKQRRAAVPIDPTRLCECRARARSLSDASLAASRNALLHRAMVALQEYENAHSGNCHASLLRLRMAHPEEASEQLASRLAERTGRPISADSLRQQLHRSRARFAELLMKEVSRLVKRPTRERVEEKLREMGLMKFMHDFMRPGGPERPEEG